MALKKIYFIEDDKETQFLLKEIFSAEDYEVQAFDHSVHALEYLKDHAYPDLLVMDLNFPHMGPDEFLQKFRSHDDGKDIPLIIFSGKESIKADAKRLGAAGYLTKPIDLVEALDLVEKSLH